MREDTASAYLVFHDEFLGNIVEIAFTHALESITYVLFYEFFIFV